MSNTDLPDSGITSAQDAQSDAAALAQAHFYETMLRERRRITRQIPVPDAVESDSPADWANFN